jgi:hypothetical protein
MDRCLHLISFVGIELRIYRSARLQGHRMPFVHDQTEMEWPKDGSDPGPPHVDQFVYLPVPEFSGSSEAVRFSTLPPVESIEPAVPKVVQPVPATPAPRRTFWDRLLGREGPAAGQQQPRISFEEQRRSAELEQERRRQQLFAVLVPALVAAGAQRAYCRYDGGNDEGFAWPDHYARRDGQHINHNELATRLFELNVHDQLRAAGFAAHLTATSAEQKIAELRAFSSGWLADEWAALLLGRGFGTGEYSMYGAFTVDLEACTITDDPHADPQVENITISR